MRNDGHIRRKPVEPTPAWSDSSRQPEHTPQPTISPQPASQQDHTPLSDAEFNVAPSFSIRDIPIYPQQSPSSPTPDAPSELPTPDAFGPDSLRISQYLPAEPTTPHVQPSLRVNTPGDLYEQEADRMADMVMRSPADSDEMAAPSNGPDMPSYYVQRAPSGMGVPVSPQVEGNISRMQGGGQPLPASERSFFEGRFGHDFSKIRIHADDHAAETAQSLDARAFTVGNDIAFDAGEYQPGTESGRHLLAHELTHTVQQEGAQQIQRQPAGGNTLPEIPENGGTPLADEVRIPFEQALGKPLGHVLIHLDPQADEAARKMGTQAFTAGNHIYFADGYFTPGTPQGDRLLAHELLHVIQQDNGRTPAAAGKGPVSDPNEPLEQEAYGSEDAIVARLAQLRGEDPTNARAAAGPPPVRPLAEDEKSDEAQHIPQAEAIQKQLVESAEDKAQAHSLPPDAQVAPVAATPTADLTEHKAVAQVESSPKTDQVRLAAAPAQSGAETPAAQPAQPILPAHPQPQVADPKTVGAIPQESAPPKATTQPLEVVPVEDAAVLAQEEDGTALAASEAEAITAEAAAAASGLETAKQAVITQVQGEVARRTELARSEAEQAKGTLQAAYQQQQATVQSQAKNALAEIEAARLSQLAAVDAFAASERERFTAAYTAQRDETTLFVQNLRQELLAAGESESQRLLAGSEERANAIISEADGQSFSGSTDLVEAQQKSTRDIAQKAANECRTTGRNVARQIQQEAAQQVQRYEQPLQDYLAQLDKSYQETSRAVEQIVTSTRQQVGQASQQAVQAVQMTEQQALAALDQKLTGSLQQIDIWTTQSATTLEQGGLQIIANLEPQITSFSTQLNSYGVDSAAQLRSVEMPIANDVTAFAANVRQELQTNQHTAQSALIEWQAGATTELNTMFEGQRTLLSTSSKDQVSVAEQIGTGSVEAIREATRGVAAGLEKLKNGLQTELAAAIDNALKEMTSGDKQFRADFTKPHQETLKVLAKKADDALASEDTTLSTARSKMAAAASEIAGKYNALAAEGEARNQQAQATPQGRIYRFLDGLWAAFTGWVESVQQWFKQTFGDFWGGLLFGIISTLVVVLVGIAVIALVALVSEVAAVVLAVVLLVGAIGLLIYNRFQEFAAAHSGQGPSFWEGVGLVTLGILDITGIPFIIEGIVGKTATGLNLSKFDSGQRTGEGIVMLGTIIFSVKRIRSMRANNSDVPVDVNNNRIELIKELQQQGVKHTPEKIIWITKNSDGKIIFLEEGTGGKKGAGLQHIIEAHADDFVNVGISKEEIPQLLRAALEANEIAGYQGSGTGRPIYKVTFNGKTYNIAITVSDNGFVVGANPTSSP